jgi:hypothetical protein
VRLADHFREALRAVFPVEGLVGHRLRSSRQPNMTGTP